MISASLLSDQHVRDEQRKNKLKTAKKKWSEMWEKIRNLVDIVRCCKEVKEKKEWKLSSRFRWKKIVAIFEQSFSEMVATRNQVTVSWRFKQEIRHWSQQVGIQHSRSLDKKQGRKAVPGRRNGVRVVLFGFVFPSKWETEICLDDKGWKQ